MPEVIPLYKCKVKCHIILNLYINQHKNLNKKIRRLSVEQWFSEFNRNNTNLSKTCFLICIIIIKLFFTHFYGNVAKLGLIVISTLSPNIIATCNHVCIAIPIDFCVVRDHILVQVIAQVEKLI